MFRPVLQRVSISDFTSSFYFRRVSPNVAACVLLWFHSIILLERFFAQCCSMCPYVILRYYYSSEMCRSMLHATIPSVETRADQVLWKGEGELTVGICSYANQRKGLKMWIGKLELTGTSYFSASFALESNDILSIQYKIFYINPVCASYHQIRSIISSSGISRYCTFCSHIAEWFLSIQTGKRILLYSTWRVKSSN